MTDIYSEHNVPGNLGCILEPPDARDYLYDDIAGGIELPKNFVLDAEHVYQNGIDSCVGHAVSAAKSVQEGEKLSPRYQWHLAKKEQGYKGWGTSVSLCLKQLVANGALPFGTFNEDVVGVDREDYMRLEVSEALQELAQKYRAKSYWRAGWGTTNLEMVKQAIYEQKVPLVTSMQWYREYDKPIKGFLPEPKTPSYGHAFILKGWKTDSKGREYFVFQNSWRDTWGDKGDFYIYVDELDKYRLGSYYAITDIESDKAKILATYKGKLIKNADSPKVYYVGKGVIGWIKNEPSFYFGRDAGFWGDWKDVITIQPQITEDIIF